MKQTFHDGERAIQDTIGMRERMAEIGPRIIRDHMPDQHRELFEKLPVLVVGTIDGEGQPWATLVDGAPGFVETPDAQTLRVRASVDAEDPAASGLRVGRALGVLGIEAHTRRRNRANGVLVDAGPAGFSVRVDQSFGNCPKYIHARRPVARVARDAEPARAEGSTLGPEARALVEASDTMFIASSSAPSLDEAGLRAAGAGVDVSHRGGPAGFVRIERGADGDVLAIADYPGNAMFNTLGNLLVFPRAGLLFVDWREGHLLQLAASAELGADAGGQRTLRLSLRGGWLRRGAMPLVWSAPEAPPQFHAPA